MWPHHPLVPLPVPLALRRWGWAVQRLVASRLSNAVAVHHDVGVVDPQCCHRPHRQDEEEEAHGYITGVAGPKSHELPARTVVLETLDVFCAHSNSTSCAVVAFKIPSISTSPLVPETSVT